MTSLSVIIPTRDRADLLRRALRSVLSQVGVQLEVVVVDDCSENAQATRDAVAAMADARVALVEGTGAGGAAARNRGARASSGDVLAFLDDDDEAEAGWAAELTAPFGDRRVAIACCGARHEEPHLGRTVVKVPYDLGPAFHGYVAMFDTGTFAVRRDVFEDAGGYADGIPSGPHFELALRLTSLCDQRGLAVAATALPLVVIHQRPPDERSRNRPDALYEGATFVLERHRDLIRRDRRWFADHAAIAGVAALRMGRLGAGRRHLWDAVAAQPLRPKHHARLVLSLIPPVARRVWPRGTETLPAGAPPTP